MDKRRLIIGGVLIAVLVIAIAAGVAYYSTNAGARKQLFEQLDIETGPATTGLLASGFIEAEEIELAAEFGGRVVELPFEEGDEVKAGTVIVQLDTALLEAQRDAAMAQIDIATAQRDLIAAGPREEIIRQAAGQVTLAQASLDAAKMLWGDTLAMYADPQEVEVQLVDAQTQVAVAQQDLAAAQVQLHSASRSLEMYYDAVKFFEDNNYKICARYKGKVLGCEKLGMQRDMALTPQTYKQAEADFAAAQEALSGAEALLATLQGFADNPSALLAQAVEAEGVFHTAEVSLERAQAELADLEGGASPEDLAVANAQIEEAKAALEVIETQIAHMTLATPINGVILQQSIHTAELAAPGVPLVTLANLDTVELTVYVPQVQFDKVRLNQTVEVTVDSFPDQTFEGTVIYISDEAEFTPRSVQTREERVNLVFAVKIRLENPDHKLKPGMPADALFE